MIARWGLVALLIAGAALPSRAGELTFPPGVESVRIPARIVDRHIFVRVTVGGRGLDMVLDTGASSLLLDDRVAAEIGAHGRAEVVQALGGAVDARRVRLAEATIGRLTLRDAVALATPFRYDADRATRAVGLLGFDFIGRCVLRIDYTRGTVDAIRPEAFQPPPGARAVALRFDQGVPLVAFTLNGVEGDRFVLDTGADLLTVFPGFAALHEAAVASVAFPGSDEPESPAHARGVGGEPSQRDIVLADARFGGERFSRLHAVVVQHRPLPIAGGDFDGLVGNAVLERFIVYLDFERNRVILEPRRGAARE